MSNVTIDNLDFFYPTAIGWMWNYCLPLGKFTTSTNKNVDLGVYIHEREISFAIVYGNEAGDYISGHIEYLYDIDTKDIYHNEIYQEVFKRLDCLGILKPYLDSKKDFFESRKRQRMSFTEYKEFYKNNI